MLLVRDQPVDILERKRALKILVQEFSQSQSSVFRAVFTLRKGHAGWKGQAAMVTRMNVNKSLKTNERLSFRVFLVHFFRIHSQSFRLCSIQCSCPGGVGGLRDNNHVVLYKHSKNKKSFTNTWNFTLKFSSLRRQKKIHSATQIFVYSRVINQQTGIFQTTSLQHLPHFH